MDIKPDFEFTSVSGRIPRPVVPNPLGLLADLQGKWVGRGFNQIWRPFNSPGQDHFLELNETLETLEFDLIPGDIPNRGLLQADITLHGLRYLQQVQDANVPGPNGKPAGIHVEPGIWVSVPPTTDPQDPDTVARMANIPHGTSLVAQGTAVSVTNTPPQFAVAGITPFVIGSPGNLVPFPESTLTNPSQFRTPAADIPNVTQAMVDNPNVVLAQGIQAKTVHVMTVLDISTVPLNPPPAGGGTSNIAFLQGTGNGPNAQAAQMSAIFWIESYTESPHGPVKHQLQYSQTVLLNFRGLSWPHVSVATLQKQ
jgi:hypothetical protein